MDSLVTQLGNLFEFPIKLRNEAADAFFYDVDALEPAERELLSPLIDLKGTIIVVSPRKVARPDKIRHYKSALMFKLLEGDSIQAIAVAGVGSSVLGTAALARNVADYTGWDVAGIVTGYGLADVVLEGLGGWFYYGGIDRLRYDMERAFDRMLTPISPATRPSAGDGNLRTALALAPRSAAGERGSPTAEALAASPGAEFVETGFPLGSFDALGNSDVRTLHDILFMGPPKLRLLVGHSKGNLLISFVLNHIKDELGDLVNRLREQHHPLFGHLTVVTLGAVVDIPTDPFNLSTHQFLGQLDTLGQINSDRFPPFVGKITIAHDVIPGVAHHLNPNIPFFMPVADVLGKAGVPRDEGVPSGEDGGNGRSMFPRNRSITPTATP